MALGITVGGFQPAFAADVAMPVKAAAPVQAVSPWTYRITPYFWMTSLTGSSTVRGHTSDVDVSFIDLLHRKIPKELFALMGAFEVRNDRFAILADVVYAKIGASKSGQKSFVFGSHLSAGVGGSVTVKAEMAIAELAAAYEIAHWGGGMPGSGTAIDVFGGGRFWWQKAEADLAVSAALNLAGFTISGGRAFAGSGDITWVDPIVGMRLRHHFAPGHEFTLSGDVGGFGVGSEFSWQAIGAYRFDFAKTSHVTWSGMIGYRALYVDYERGAGVTRYEFDVLQHGPVVGISARF
jgi:hypothetical protein